MAAKEILVKKYVVRLNGEERERLETLIRRGKSPASSRKSATLVGLGAPLKQSLNILHLIVCLQLECDRYDGC